MDYEQDLNKDIKTPESQDAEVLKAAITRFFNEAKKQLNEMATINTNKVISGEIEVGTAVKAILDKNQTRKVAFIKNNGMLECKVYGIDKESTGGYVLWPRQEVTIMGYNAIAVSTVSGITTVCYIES